MCIKIKNFENTIIVLEIKKKNFCTEIHAEVLLREKNEKVGVPVLHKPEGISVLYKPIKALNSTGTPHCC